MSQEHLSVATMPEMVEPSHGTVRNYLARLANQYLHNSERYYPDQAHPSSLEKVTTLQKPGSGIEPLFIFGQKSEGETTQIFAINKTGIVFPCIAKGERVFFCRYSLPYREFVGPNRRTELQTAQDILGKSPLVLIRKQVDKETVYIDQNGYRQRQNRNLFPTDGSSIHIDGQEIIATACSPFIGDETSKWKINPAIADFLLATGMDKEKVEAIWENQTAHQDSFDPNTFFSKYDLSQSETPVAVNILNKYHAAVRLMYQRYPKIEFQGWTEDMIYLSARAEEETVADAGYICEALNTEGESLHYMMTLSGKLFPIVTQKRGAKTIMNCVSESYVLDGKRVRKVLFGSEVPVENNTDYFVDLNNNAGKVEEVIITAVTFHPIRIVADGPDHLSEIITEHLSGLFEVSPKKNKKSFLNRLFY